jgi:hypothetical protein
VTSLYFRPLPATSLYVRPLPAALPRQPCHR